ncbi:MAG: hypothetical protein HC884_01220 [Chloroflexaceae bacterium]|nr:hypothetical protein [Chloroflexaceae bacterium]
MVRGGVGASGGDAGAKAGTGEGDEEVVMMATWWPASDSDRARPQV